MRQLRAVILAAKIVLIATLVAITLYLLSSSYKPSWIKCWNSSTIAMRKCNLGY